MNNLEKAKLILEEGGYTCVILGKEPYTSTFRGVKPLLDLLESSADVRGCSAADRVVGKAAAFLYVLLGVSELYTGILSKPAKAVLEKYGIKVSCGMLVDVIFNRDNTGNCPMETAVWDIEEPEKALIAIKAKLEALLTGNI